MEHERDVGGLRCTQVLAQLSDYLDGELEEDARERIESHLRGCDWCECFGGEFSAAVKSLRWTLTTPPALDEALRERLHERMRDEFRRV